MNTLTAFASEFKLTKQVSNFQQSKITSSIDAANYARQFYFDDLEIFESFFVIYLNHTNKTIGFVKIGQGGINSTVVDPRLILKYAIESLATGLILVHNHPSGNTQPSPQDHKLTRQIIDIAKLLEVKVLDHIILTSETYYSFADHGNI